MWDSTFDLYTICQAHAFLELNVKNFKYFQLTHDALQNDIIYAFQNSFAPTRAICFVSKVVFEVGAFLDAMGSLTFSDCDLYRILRLDGITKIGGGGIAIRTCNHPY